MTDALRESVSGFGELFGTAGAGFEALINTMSDYADRRAEINQRIAEADERTAEGQRERERASAELARAEVGYYGNILGASKRLFSEKSAGYKVLETAEKAYRAYQTVSAIIEAVNTARSIALDGTKTASSVANSGARATADGIAGIAKAIASLPFPFNIAAGAATAAALVAFGVELFGGSGGGAASSAIDIASGKTEARYSGATDEYGNPTSAYSVLRAGGTTVANDNSSAPAPGMNGGNANAGGTANSWPTYNISIEGNADEQTVEQLRQALAESEDRAVERSRRAVSMDIALRGSRQRIGGSAG